MKKIDYSDIVKDNALRLNKLTISQQESYHEFSQYLLDHNVEDINLYSSLALSNLENGGTISKDHAKYLNQIKDSKQITEEMKKIRDRDYEKYSVANLWSVFTIFIVLLFFKNWLTNHYLINYSVDILIAILALAIALRNFVTKRNLINKYHFTKKYFYLDILVVVVCFIIKLLVSGNFDITFLLLVITYFISQRAMKKLFREVI